VLNPNFPKEAIPRKTIEDRSDSFPVLPEAKASLCTGWKLLNSPLQSTGPQVPSTAYEISTFLFRKFSKKTVDKTVERIRAGHRDG
jgi:hypothetical protein